MGNCGWKLERRSENAMDADDMVAGWLDGCDKLARIGLRIAEDGDPDRDLRLRLEVAVVGRMDGWMTRPHRQEIKNHSTSTTKFPETEDGLLTTLRFFGYSAVTRSTVILVYFCGSMLPGAWCYTLYKPARSSTY